jgi:hypothetical protein
LQTLLRQASEDRDFYQLSLHEEKLNCRQLTLENKRAKQSVLKQAQNGGDNSTEIKGLLDDLKRSMQPSQASIERMKLDIREVEESQAVREYKFITQQLAEDPGLWPQSLADQDNQMNAEESLTEHPKEHLKLIEESRFMKFKLDKL